MTARRLLPVIAPVRRRVVANARAIGCTCPAPDVRWDPAERVPVVLHDAECPRHEDLDGPSAA